jgi:choline monooxygenase
MIDVKRYFLDEFLNQEIDEIFKKNWVYACLTEDIKSKNDYRTLEFKNLSIFIYNTGNGIKAFKNICPHRFNKIFTSVHGNGPIVCKFHSWSFDSDGKNKNPEIRKLDQKTQSCLSLDHYQVSIVGKFIFINLHEDAPPLEKYLGNYYEKLIQISENLGTEIYHEQNLHNTNWKLIVENVIDKSHCKSLHRNTLVNIGLCVKKDEEEFFDIYASSIRLYKIDSYKNEKTKMIINKYLPRNISNDYYEHIYIFPNLTIGIFEGLNFTIGNILPIKVDKTVYELKYYFSEIKSNNPISYEILENMKSEVIRFGNQVFQEDKEILEVVQKSIHLATHNGYLISNESRLRHFYDLYNEKFGL